MDNAPATTDVALLYNRSTSLFTGGINIAGGNGNIANFSVSRFFAAGDTLDFSVGFGNGFYGNDSTGLATTISRVTGTAALEPGSLALLAFPLISLGGVIVRRRTSRKEN